MKINITDPKIGKYFVVISGGLHLPVKVIKLVATGYLCRYYWSCFPLVNCLYKNCKCECKYKCIRSNLICLKDENLVKKLDPKRGRVLVGK